MGYFGGNPDHISLGFVLGLGLRLGVNMVILRMGGKVFRRLFNNNNNIFCDINDFGGRMSYTLSAILLIQT